MAKNIPDAYAELVKQISTIEGMRNAPDFPQENPTAFSYLEMGQIEVEYGGLTFNQPLGAVKFPFKIHTLRGKDLARAVKELLPFAERLATLLMYGTNQKNLNGTVNSTESLTCKMIPSGVGDKDTLCWDCVFTVKIYAGASDV